MLTKLTHSRRFPISRLLTALVLAVAIAFGAAPAAEASSGSFRPVNDTTSVSNRVVARVEHKVGKNQYEPHCTAFKIDRNYLLTAAHCLFRDNNPQRAWGARNLRVVLRPQSGGKHRVCYASKTWAHGNYKKSPRSRPGGPTNASTFTIGGRAHRSTEPL